jgi:hypothetical protein
MARVVSVVLRWKISRLKYLCSRDTKNINDVESYIYNSNFKWGVRVGSGLKWLRKGSTDGPVNTVTNLTEFRKRQGTSSPTGRL